MLERGKKTSQFFNRFEEARAVVTQHASGHKQTGGGEERLSRYGLKSAEEFVRENKVKDYKASKQHFKSNSLVSAAGHYRRLPGRISV